MSGHDHDHGAAGAGNRGKLIIVFCITFAVMVAEIIGALLAGSLALLADAGHMFTDSTGLLIALIAASLALKAATMKRTWGYKRAEIIASAGQAALLLGVGGFVVVEGIRRLFQPPEVGGDTMLWFGIIGLAVNVIRAWTWPKSASTSWHCRTSSTSTTCTPPSWLPEPRSSRPTSPLKTTA